MSIGLQFAQPLLSGLTGLLFEAFGPQSPEGSAVFMSGLQI